MKKVKDKAMPATRKESTDHVDAFSSINERPVDDISLEFFYKPHTITLLAVSIASVIYSAFVRFVLYSMFIHYPSKLMKCKCDVMKLVLAETVCNLLYRIVLDAQNFLV